MKLPLATLDDALAALSVCTDYEKMARTGHGYARLDLSTIERLVRRLGDPHLDYRVVHVAGTKGKGSTTRLVARILEAAGERVGEYTSPHLVRLTERIRVRGAEIPGEAVAAILSRVTDELHSDGADANRPTFFDFMTAIAFARFADERVTTAVVEVGMGGRLDSTNVVGPDVSVITSISLDHTEALGDTHAAIAAEKAGIVKPGVPVVTGVDGTFEGGPAEALEAIRAAAKAKGAPVHAMREDFHVGPAEPADVDGRAGIRFTVSTWRTPILEIEMPVLGAHQARNAAVAIAAIEVLRESGAVSVSDDAIVAALRDVELPARMEIVASSPLTIVDTAHNDGSSHAAGEALALHFPNREAVVCFGCAKDKDAGQIAMGFLPFVREWILTRAPSPRAALPEDLVDELPDPTQPVTIVPDPLEAVRLATRRAGPRGMVLVIGSFYLAGAVRESLVARGGRKWRE
ncbi:MAG: bifunctional folylpolyglutamate synthase/dihydrofolate synthase [Planctomycetes bacterium]|nr:bifunctional folylpolyglutamate synthase/dihydrofolate synthase [Planctomycetota bacterium]